MEGVDEKATHEFIKDLRELFAYHNVFLHIEDDYDGMDNYYGKTIETRSFETVDGNYPIYFEDMVSLAGKQDRDA